MSKPRLALSWGPSFAEMECGSSRVLTYTAQTPVPQLIKPFANPDLEARASLSVMRKILDTRLGNSVGQIVTKGFEHWVSLRQEADPGRFDLNPSRREPLANPDHLVALNERISADGKVLQPLQLPELEKIAADMKKKSIERVCVNLMFSHRNPIHQKQVTQFLTEKGFQVFSQSRNEKSLDELSAWRRNLLDAALASFFERIKTEMNEALPGVQISYLDTEKGFVSADQVSTTGLLFGRELALQRSQPFLYFGPEQWCWILPSQQNQWKSPWGLIELQRPDCGFFSLQPGRELLLTPEGRLRWGVDLGMDPGPMLWGRSSKMTLLDLMGWHFETQPALRRNEKSEQKVKDQVDSLKKNSRDWAKYDSSKIQNEVWTLVIESFFAELAHRLDSDTVEVGGVMAPAIFPFLKKARPKWNWTLNTKSMLETAASWERLNASKS